MIQLCADCWEQRFGYEPDMGDDASTFYPGVCDNGHDTGSVVFSPADYLDDNLSYIPPSERQAP